LSGTRAARAARSGGQARLTALILIVTLVAAAWMVYPVFRLQYEHRRQADSLESELEGLKSRNDELRDEVDELKTPEGVEEVARDTLGLVKPGEQAYVVTGGVTGESLETSATASPGPGEPPLWQRALDALFGLE
jgi:cell division protein FtsL